MKTMTKTGVVALLTFCFLLGLSSCCKDDPDYSAVTPPTVAVAYGLVGKINTISGVPIEGVKVTAKLGSEVFTVTTNAKGEYSFEGLKQGTYTVTAESAGKMTEVFEVTIGSDIQSNMQVHNISMPNVGTSVDVISGQEKVVVTETETFTNKDAVKVTITSTIPVGAVTENAKLIFTPLYTIEQAVNTRAASVEIMVSGIAINSTNANLQLTKNISMDFALPAGIAELAVIKKYKNGQWTTVPSTIQGAKVLFEADALASYAFFISLEESVSAPGSTPTIPIIFSQSKFDNLYGGKDMSVGSVSYQYMSGSEILGEYDNPTRAFLVELLAKKMKGTKATKATANHTINTTLPIGTILSIEGSQQVKTISYSINGYTVTGREYGNVAIRVTTANRTHTGGGN